MKIIAIAASLLATSALAQIQPGAKLKGVTSDSRGIQIGVGNTTACETTACTSALRGKLCYSGGAAGSGDMLKVCVKDSTDYYFWQTLYDDGAALDVQLTTCGTTPTVAKGGSLTVTRASSQIAIAGGCAVTASSNQLAITPKGALIWGAGTNQLSNSLTTGTAYQATVTAATTDVTDPMGGHNAIKICDTNQAGTHAFYQTFSASAGSVGSVYMKAGTKAWGFMAVGTGTQNNFTYDLTNCTAIGSSGGAESTGVNGWCRLWDNATTNNQFWMGTATASGTANYTGDGTGCVYVWGEQVETFASATLPIVMPPGPYTPTTSAPVSWPATVVTIPNPLTTLGQHANLCVYAQGTMGNWRIPGLTNIQPLFALANGTTNSALLSITQAGSPQFINDVYDGAGGSRRATYANSAFLPGTLHNVMGCTASGINQTLYNDGVLETSTLSGSSATGLQAVPTTAYLGSWGGYYMNGWLARVKMCNTTSPARCL